VPQTEGDTMSGMRGGD